MFIFFIYLFVPLRYLQFLRIARFTSQPASREQALQSLPALRVQITQVENPSAWIMQALKNVLLLFLGVTVLSLSSNM